MTSDFETTMRGFEYYHSLKLLPDTYTVIRVDGKGFTKFTSDYDKPFDLNFHENMCKVAEALMEGLNGVYCYTESDEISLLLKPNFDLYDRELEKIVSISAAIASANMSLLTGRVAQFDSRVWVGINKERVVDYFRWRQADASRCCLNSWCYWTLRKDGKSASQATKILDKQTKEFKHELLFSYGINFNDLPLWQRRGTGLHYQDYVKIGYNPKTQESVECSRRKIVLNKELGLKDDYNNFIMDIIKD